MEQKKIRYSCETAINTIHSLTRFGSQLGLERISKLLELIGNPQDKMKFIHIAGTNGKGTTVHMCESVLMKAGYRVGTYTSPYVNDFRERFCINKKMITHAQLGKYFGVAFEASQEMLKDGFQVTEFEMITAIAFLYFQQENCDIVCLEVGLGGKYDATNVIKTPELAIITSISYDHVEILGDTLAKIAGEKAGIIKQNSTVVTYPEQEQEALLVIEQKCRETNSTLFVPQKHNICVERCTAKGSSFSYKGHNYCIQMVGDHQVLNAVAVIEAMENLAKRGYRITPIDIRMGIGETKVSARFQKINMVNPEVYIDGAHNQQAGISLANSIKKLPNKNIIAVIGMMADKDCESFVSSIAGVCNGIVTVPVQNPRAIEPKKLALIAKKYCDNVFACDDIFSGLEKARGLSGGDVIVICGSFYLASEMEKAVFKWHNK